ncbi:MAG TPA: rRNA maturation RNase YbeY [Dehalococcoidales bacterium]|nr:rRNA maturation RNase YbeY [Dehalococcoidales bacterium]
MGLRAMEINILIDEGLAADLEPAWLEAVAGEVLVAEGVGADTEVELLVSTQERIQQLNRDYRGKDEPTDVLSFSAREQAADSPPFIPPPDGVLHLGEVIISYPQALKQAEERGHPLKKELAILLIHGLLHLLGYDHEEEAQEHKMQAREKELLGLIEGGTK